MGSCVSSGKKADRSHEGKKSDARSREASPSRISRERIRKSIDYAGQKILKGLQASSHVGYAAAKPVALHVKNRAKALKRLSVDLGNIIVHRKPIVGDPAYGMRKVQQHYAPFGKGKGDTKNINVVNDPASKPKSSENSEITNQLISNEVDDNSYEAIACAHLDLDEVSQDSSQKQNNPGPAQKDDEVQRPLYSKPEPLLLSDEEGTRNSDTEELGLQNSVATSKKPKKRLPRRFGAAEDSIEGEANAAGLKHHLHEMSAKKRENLNPTKKVEKVLTRIVDGAESVKFSQRAAVHR